MSAALLVAVRADTTDELAKILRLPEIPVHRGEANVGDLIEACQGFHHEAADHVAGDLGLTGTLELAHDGIDDPLDALGLDRPLAQRNVDRARELVAVEGLALGVLLDHGELAQLHALKGGEARGAVRAKPAAPDRRAILGRPGILDLRILASAKRTAHPTLPPVPPARCPALRAPDKPGTARRA